jgi:hypothetical protein
VCLTKQSVPNILELIIASDELLLEELLSCIQDYLIEIRSTWVRQELILVLHTVSTLSSFKKLQDYCIESILEDPKSFITTENFLSLDKNILYELLKRDDFVIEEDIAWDYLIKWGIEQTPSLRNRNYDGIKWNNENLEVLKDTLSQFIPLIRFSEMSSVNFFDKVRPFKAIIPNTIYEEFMQFHMKGTLTVNAFSPRLGTIHIDSKIIKLEHAYVIANWIEKKDAKSFRNKKGLQYEFILLYRNSRDSFNLSTYNSFRIKCRNQGPFLILIKPQSHANNSDIQQVSNNFDTLASTEFYGEYNSYCANNFIFSFANDNDIKNMKICRNYDSKYDKNKFNLSSAFHMDGQNIFINESIYNDNNVISSSMTNFISKEIEVFIVKAPI